MTFVVAAAPVLATICEIDCDAPKAAATESCHAHAAAADGASVRDAARECRTQHAPSDAIVTKARALDVTAIALDAFITADIFAPDLVTRRSEAFHGPPGSVARSSTAFNTVLRI